MIDSIIEDIEREFLAECEDDYVGLWSLVRRFRDRELESSKVLDATLGMLKRLLEKGKIVCGTFVGTEFKVCEVPIDKLIGKIRDAWIGLSRDPQIAEIAWFTSSSYRR